MLGDFANFWKHFNSADKAKWQIRMKTNKCDEKLYSEFI